VVESASEIGLTRRLGEEEYCKNRAKMVRFWLCRCGWQTAGSAPIEKSIRNVAIRRDGRYNGVVFEVKKEIPGYGMPAGMP